MAFQSSVLMRKSASSRFRCPARKQRCRMLMLGSGLGLIVTVVAGMLSLSSESKFSW
jgi:hypothetical protein